MQESRAGGTARPPSPQPRSRMLSGTTDDEMLAAVYINMWALASGRTLRRDVPPGQLSEDELITFWADDMTPVAGRHAMPDKAFFPAVGDPVRASRPAAKPRPRPCRSAISQSAGPPVRS